MNGIIIQENMLKFILVAVIITLSPTYATDESSPLDAFVGILRTFRLGTINYIRTTENTGRRRFRTLASNHKLQDEIPVEKPFPCDPNVPYKSKTVPNSIHKLRPGDINVIGAIGDSLTAGFGLIATNPLEVTLEGRGKSFSIGGEDTWRTTLTLPNILKVFNPNLIGFALKSSYSIERASQFNVAEGGAVSQNMPYMTKVLLRRITRDKRVNLKKDWKMITHMIGDNDFCSEICFSNDLNQLLENHRQDLLSVLRLLRDNLPRTIVNIIPPPHLEVLTLMHDKPAACYFSHKISCPCMSGLAYKPNRKIYFDFMRKWQLLDIEVSNLPEFDLEEFTVIPHHYTLNYTFPRTPSGGLDYTFLSEDCFHFSQKGTARFANDLWNSIMEPFGKKAIDGDEIFKRFNCPTASHPYIFTRRNSN